ncbi:MAG: SIR2 family protein [Verrucomicrobiota bacterium]
MDIPHALVDQIQNGKVVIFLGAGASMCAKDGNGNFPPSGKKLGEMLSDKFLGGKFKTSQLNQIAELAISETDITTVQSFIKDTLEAFQPAPPHLLLPKFKWMGIATTNYDRLIERAYEMAKAPLQTPKTFIENGDRVEDSMRDSTGVMVLKLHGCLTRLSNVQCPLILTTDQYVSHRKGRSRIFDHLKDWACEFPIVFVGSSLQDSDIRSILHEVASIADSRPRYYVVSPVMDEIEVRFWEAKRISPIKATFEGFMQALDSKIPEVWRALTYAPSKTTHPIKEKFAQNNIVLTRNCSQYLESDVEYVKTAASITNVSAQEYYKGYDSEWSAIEQNLDVRRVLADTILSDRILESESNRPSGIQFILIKAHAGSGKTTLLKRIAWDAAHEYDAICLYLRQSGLVNTSALQEIISACKERIYLFIDDVGDRVKELQSLIRNIEQYGKHLTIIAAERLNEWNVSAGMLNDYVTSEYELKYLTNFEIDKLIELLEKHKALGTLRDKSLEERRVAFREIAGRQILVALHEATFGSPFEDIIENEYKSILPIEAQKIYLTICVLNRLGVPVRAGVIARVHGIRFEEFQNRLFKPLEHVVASFYDEVIRDFVYTARHQFIAEIVFERVLVNQEERFDHYIKCLNTLNVDYACDRKAFRQMVRGRTLLDMFSNTELVEQIYLAAEELVGDDAHLCHQKGLYEMHRGNLAWAERYFLKAEKLAPEDYTIKHSISELLLKNAEQARTYLEKDKYLRRAAEIATLIKNSKVASESHAYHSLVKIDIQRLSDLLSVPVSHSEQPAIESIVKHIEKNLNDGLQQYPGDPFLLTAEAEFAALLNDSGRVVDSLKKAFEVNPRATFIGLRLAAYYKKEGKLDEAKQVLETALNSNRTDRPLHYHFAKYLMENVADSEDSIIYHLQHSFSPGDRNFDAQLLYGRQLYVSGNHDGAKEVFRRMKEARVSPETKGKLLYPLDGEYRGAVIRMEGNYIFLSKDGTNEHVFVHRNNIPDAVWSVLSVGTRFTYKIAFNFHGPGGYDLKP